jgi:hypothetical protein
MSKNDGGSLEREGVAALAHMEAALTLLDTFDQPIEVAAHLDLAIHRLREALESAPDAHEPKPPSG